jgi:pimeloyl-ACP methyl ester carboxylesterase
MEYPASKVAAVANGDIEYCLVGKGPPILVSHGTLGGYDQALAIADLFNQARFSFLAVSRAGYLRSSPETGRTPEEQARSFVALLDHLDIAAAAVMGLSGGALAALSFARDYPERCRALVLISAIATAPPPLPPFFRLAVRLQPLTMRFDPLWALFYRYGLRLLLRANGLRREQVAQLYQDPHLLNVARGIFRPIASSSRRREGFRLDDAQIRARSGAGNDEIRVPTYASHAANDPLAPSSSAAQLARSIPGAEYHELPDGGHLFFVAHSRQVVPNIERFLLTHAPW